MLIAAINEQLQATDGGGVELIDFDGEMLTVRLHGACVGCPMSQYTLAMGIGQTVKQFFPGLKQIQAV
ncbi:MAG TPA: NifU family protein [Anaerolineae bacterium]|nr:NifU family protein [Anaerolineae bacterium]HIQ04537.1 NifU family protein [Anaerolineae bacterium]